MKMLALAEDDKEYQTLCDSIEDVNQVYTNAIHSVGFKIQQLYTEVKPVINQSTITSSSYFSAGECRKFP